MFLTRASWKTFSRARSAAHEFALPVIQDSIGAMLAVTIVAPISNSAAVRPAHGSRFLTTMLIRILREAIKNFGFP